MIGYTKNTIRICLFLIFLFGKSGIEMTAQTTLIGKIIDGDSGEELIGANVVLFQNGNMVAGTTTDIDGKYKFAVEPGIYTVEASYTGFPTEKVENFFIEKNKERRVNIDLKIDKGKVIYCYFFTGYKIPLLKMDDTTVGHILSSEQIKKLPTRNINEITAITPGVSFSP